MVKTKDVIQNIVAPLACVALVSYVAYGYANKLYLRPLQVEIAKKQAQWEELKRENEKVRALTSQLDQVESEAKRIRNESQTLRQRLPTKEQISTVITELSQFCKSEGLTLALESIPPKRQRGLQMMNVNLTLKVNGETQAYQSFLRLMKWIADYRQLILVDRYALRSNLTGDAQLEVKLSVPIDYKE
ncbi:MAG: type 4a pilus biogenesis protein PilO [Verrucomicrobiia bacterium]